MKTIKTLTLAFAAAAVAVGTARAQVTLRDIGAANPTPGPIDISQLSTVGNQHLTGGFNYYTDNATPPGQTFNMGANSLVMTSVSIKTGTYPLDSGGGGLGPQTYELRIFSVVGSSATLMNTYTSSSFSYVDGDWLRWTNMNLTLAANTTYAYTFRRSTAGWDGLAVASGNLYTGGEVVLIPSAGGTMTFQGSHGFDAAFVIGLASAGGQLIAGQPIVSPPTNYIGSTITISAGVVGDPPLYYQWLTDGGGSVTLTNIPDATNASLIVTPSTTGTYKFNYIVTNSLGSATSSIAVVPVIAGTPIVSPAVTNFIGLPVTLTSPAGNDPSLSYQWQSGGSSGSLTNIPDATNVSLTVTPPYTGTFRFDYVLTYGSVNFTSSVATVTILGAGNVSVNLYQRMAPMLSEGLGVASAVYDNYLTSAGTAASLATAGIKAVRYPGGSYADIFHWATYTGCGGYLAAGGTFDNWINNVVTPAGAQAIITVNYGSNPTCNAGADPSEAAAWVQYANVTRGLGIKYWEIGNEQGGNGYYAGYNWEYDLHYLDQTPANRVGKWALSPTAYGSNSLQFINAMKAVDPTIKVGIGFDTGRPAYNTAALGQCGSVADFVIIHWYPSGTADQVLASTLQIASTANSARTQLTNIVGAAHAAQMTIAVTEDGPPTSLPVGAPASLFAADNFMTWIENGAANVDYQELHNGFLANNNILLGPAYGAKMSRLLASVGDSLIKAASDQSRLHVHATTRQDAKVGVMIINTDPILTVPANVTISGPSYASDGIQYAFGLTNFVGSSPNPSYPISTNSVSGLGNSFSILVPPYTIINLLLSVANNTAPNLAAISDQTVNVGSNLVVSASAGDTEAPPQTLTFALLSGPANSSVNPNTGAFSWRPWVTDANSTNLISLMVADNGSPVLSATQSFNVFVNPLPQASLTSGGISGGLFTLNIGGVIDGPDYAVQTSTNLINWSTLSVLHSLTTWTDTNTANLPSRFYRIKVGPPLP